MDLFETGKVALIIFLVLLTLDVLVWLLWANKIILTDQGDGMLIRWNIGLIMLIWLLSCIVGIIASILMILYAWLA